MNFQKRRLKTEKMAGTYSNKKTKNLEVAKIHTTILQFSTHNVICTEQTTYITEFLKVTNLQACTCPKTEAAQKWAF